MSRNQNFVLHFLHRHPCRLKQMWRMFLMASRLSLSAHQLQTFKKTSQSQKSIHFLFKSSIHVPVIPMSFHRSKYHSIHYSLPHALFILRLYYGNSLHHKSIKLFSNTTQFWILYLKSFGKRPNIQH